jgi:MFS family permease
MAALTALIGLAASTAQVALLRTGASTARGLRSPQRYASVPERVGEADYGRAFGFERGWHHFVSVLGPLLAFAALAVLGVRGAVVASVVPGVAAIVIGVRLLRRRRPAPATPPVPARLQLRAVYRGDLGRLMVGVTLFEAVNFAAVLLILRATKLLERQDVVFGAAATAVLLYMLWRLAAAVAAPLSGRMVDRWGAVPVLAAGVGLLLFSYAGFAFVEGTVAQLVGCFLAAGAASAAIEAAEHVGVARYAPADLRFSAFGALSAVRSFGRLTATVGATVVWTALGPQWGLMLATPVMVVAVAVTDPRGARLVRAADPVLMAVLVPVAVVLLLVALGVLRGY